MSRNNYEDFTCCICGRLIKGEYGNNPWPVVKEDDAKCCDQCDLSVVLEARLKEMRR